MSKLFHNRWLRWALFVAALIALGVGIYQIQPPEPMCEIDSGDIAPARFLANGRLATLRGHGKPAPALQGPLQIWDVRTGAEIARYFVDEDDWLRSTVRLSPNGEMAVRRMDDGDDLAIHETASGKLLHRRAVKSMKFMPIITDALVLYSIWEADDREDIEVWSSRERKVIAALTGVKGEPLVSPDGARIVFRRAAAKRKSEIERVVWDVSMGRVVAEIPEQMEEALVISDDGKWIAGHANGHRRIELRDLATGQLLGASPLTGSPLAFSSDGRLLAVFAPENALVMLETPAMKTLWSQQERAWWHRNSFFSQDLRTIFTQDGFKDAKCYDCRNGQCVWSAEKPNVVGTYLQPTDNHQAILVLQDVSAADPLPTWMHWIRRVPGFENIALASEAGIVVSVLDADARAERFQIFSSVDNVSGYMLSSDGRLLAMVHWDTGRPIIRCWDVDAGRPLRWAVGVPVGFGVMGVLLARRRRRTLAAKPEGTACPS